MNIQKLREIADRGPLECSCHGDPELCVCSAIIALCDAHDHHKQAAIGWRNMYENLRSAEQVKEGDK